MAYRSLDIEKGLPPILECAVREVIDPIFLDLHYLLPMRHPGQGVLKGSMQRVQAILLLAAIDGAAQLLEPGSMNDGRRFQRFLEKRFPWDHCPAIGLSIEEACEFLWHAARGPLLHRFGATDQPLLRTELGDVHTFPEEMVDTLIESSPVRPLTSGAIERDSERTVLWIENLYWGLRRSIEAAVSDQKNAAAAAIWIEEGKFDHMRARVKARSINSSGKTVELGRGLVAWVVSAIAMIGTAIVDYSIWDWMWGRIQAWAPLVNLGPVLDFILLAAAAPLVLGFVLVLVLLPVLVAGSARDGAYLMLGGGLGDCLMRHALSRTGKTRE